MFLRQGLVNLSSKFRTFLVVHVSESYLRKDTTYHKTARLLYSHLLEKIRPVTTILLQFLDAVMMTSEKFRAMQ